MAFEVVSDPVEGGYIAFLKQKILAVHGIQAAIQRAEMVYREIAEHPNKDLGGEANATVSTLYTAHEGSVFCTYTHTDSVKEGEYREDEESEGGFVVVNEHEIELPDSGAGRAYHSKRIAIKDGQIYALTSDGRYRIVPKEDVEGRGGGLIYQPGSYEGMLHDPVTGRYLG